MQKHMHVNDNFNDDYLNYVDEAAMPLDENADYQEVCDAIMARKKAGLIHGDFKVSLLSGEEIRVFVDKVQPSRNDGRVRRQSVKYGIYGSAAGNDAWSQPVAKGRETIASNMEELSFGWGIKVSSSIDKDENGRSVRIALVV